MSEAVQLLSFIGGQWTEGCGGAYVSQSPANPDTVVAEGRLSSLAELDEAVSAAGRAQPGWARTPPHERGAVLLRAAECLETAADEWGVELAREEGKTRAEGVGEVLRAVQVLRFYGNDADRQSGEIYSSPRRGERIFVTRKPVGVVGVITPFNFPIAIPAWKIAPALTYGNTVVWKPAATVPLLAMRLAQALASAGLPDGVLNLMLGDSPIGNGIVEHPGIDAVTFTGSTAIGRKIAAVGAARGVAVQAEMGGKNAAIVLGDADLQLAAQQVMLGAFRSAGQKCTATSRLIVVEDVAAEFLDVLRADAAALTVGDPVAAGTDMGPVINHAAQQSIQRGIDRALAQGARRITGGVAYDEGELSKGYFVAPTILELPSPTIDFWRDELFGPVLGVITTPTAASAFDLANDSEYGLSASIFTEDLSNALHAMDVMDVGVLHINSESAGADPHVPFGGTKKSGYGPKEQGTAARDFFTHATTAYLRSGRSQP